MVKYGKQYRLLQLDEWKKYYLNYKKLKQKIKEMKKKLMKDLRPREDGKIIRPSLLSIPLLPDESNDIDNISSAYKDNKGQYLKEFVDLLVNEFLKSYRFFLDVEKILFEKINNHLYIQTSYSTYSLAELSKEMKSLSLTIYLAKSINAFINDIMMAIKKILKKFDKNFSTIYGLITPHLILQLLSKQNSELDYILEFKIDEISIIVESSAEELKNYFDQNNENSANNTDNIEYKNEFLIKYNETLKYIKDIDELLYFKTQYKDWTDYISGKKGLKKRIKFIENDIFNPILSAPNYKDNLLDKFLSTKEAFEEIKNMRKPISSLNKRNIILILAQTFFNNTLLTCIFPILYFYEYIFSFEQDNKNHLFWFLNILIFSIIGVTYFAQFLSIFFFYNYISIKKIKFSNILFNLFILVGSLIYILSIFSNENNEGHYKVRALFLGFSRFFVGLGSNSMLGKKYITLYTPKYNLPLISKIYLIIELSGYILGPSIAALFCFIRIGEKLYCLFNCIGYYGLFGSITLLILNSLLFTLPEDSNFLIVKNQTKDDVNITTSQANKKNFEDDDDFQDKEFYRLQKEANERKKAGLSITKSEDVQISINESQNNKSGINNTISSSNINDSQEKENEKEDSDNIYNKILEDSGQALGQEEITEKYLNNVDIGRYSDVDISKEQKETIKEIETKLYECQEKSNFTYINMMPRTIDDIILKEQKTFGYMNRNFIIILLLLLFNNFIKENLVIYSSYYILFIIYDKLINPPKGKRILEYSHEERGEIQNICLIISGELLTQIFSIFFIMPFYKVNLIFKKNLIIFMITSIILMIPLSIPILDIIYVPLVSLDIFIHKVIEIMLCCYLVYLIPPQWKYAHIRASSLPIYLMTFAKMSSCFLCFSCIKGPKDVQNIDELKTIFKYNHHILLIITFFIYGIFGFIIFKSSNFRVKALARALRKRAME